MTTRRAAAFLLLMIAAAAPVRADRINVAAGTPLQAAVDAAAPGDTLVLDNGGFPGAVVIDKRLRIVVSGSALIDPLGAPVGVDITADDVAIAVKVGAGLHITGDCPTDAGLRVHGRSGVRVRGVQMGCRFETAVGLDLMSVTDSQFKRLIASGDVGIRVRQLVVSAHVSIDLTEGNGVAVGALLEDIAPGAQRAGGLKMRRSLFTNGPSPAAVRLVNSDGTMIVGSYINGGLELDAGSDNNFVRGSVIPTITDAGTGNCFLNNDGHPDSCP